MPSLDSPAIERSYDQPYPVEYVGTKANGIFGKLPVIEVDALPDTAKRNAQIMNNMLARAYNTLDPKSVQGRIGWECLRLRCLVFQMTQKQYLEVSQLGDTSQSTIKSIEEGRGRITTYSTLLQEWPEIGRSIHAKEEPTEEIARVRELVSQLIVADKPKTVARLILRLMYKHGRDKSDLLYKTILHRAQDGDRGFVAENYAAVKQFAICEMDPKEADMQTDASLWNHAYMKEFREFAMSEQMKLLQQRGQRSGPKAKLVEYLKLIVTPLLTNVSKESIKKFWPSISQAQAASLMRDQMTESAVPERILATLVAENVIPEHVVDKFMKVWEEALSCKENGDTPVGHQLWDKLIEQGMTDSMVAEIFDIADASRTTKTRDKIRDGSIMDTRVPPFAVACLATEDNQEAREMLKKFFAEHRTRPYHRGKNFSTVYQVMSQYGLTLEDMSEKFGDLDIQRYEQDQKTEPEAEFFTETHRLGRKRAARHVSRWIAMHAPRTMRDVGEWMPLKEEIQTEFAVRANVTPYRIRRIASGEEVLPLPKMRALVEGGNARWTPELEIDWYLSRPDVQHYETPLAKTVHTTIGTVGEHGHELYVKNHPEEASAPLSANLHRRSITSIMQGGKDDTDVERVLTGFGIKTDSETGVFYRCLQKATSMSAALNAWCKEMRKQKKHHLVQNLIQLKQYVHFLQTRTEDLDALLEEKRWIRENMHSDEWLTSLSANHILNKPLEVLRMLPGISLSDLKSWNSGEGAQALKKEMPDFTKELSQEWTEKEMTAVEQCRQHGIDPEKPTQELPNSPMKALILQARMELESPLHLEGDQREALIHLPSYEDVVLIDEDELAWEAEVEQSFLSRGGRLNNVKENLAAAVNRLVHL